ncbi:epidermal growth factor receptor kinase substrate 8-like protein 3b [Anguilla anguilla]|uniref:epidermal growth factor receptor kinase substrate 8-like protein 3b n=1 Tax=Anguilla anguilla TaxID=7936 RepID=UPI0015B26641|nr:epidermal growth factor receptor kinase substrate 8-like protein 3b [Anguilla anguilla]
MYGISRPFSYDTPDYGGSLQSYGLSRELPSSQRSSMSRPSGKSIYMQRKEYSESINRQPDNFQYRVEHLFTCEMDGQEVRSLDDCIARLKVLDSKGRVWGQEMILEVRGGNLQLTDIETKGELESLALGNITQIKAILDSCAYNSLLTITVKQWRGPESKVYMFQCEEVGAENIKNDLEKAAQYPREDVGDPYWKDHNIRDNLENIIGQHVPGGFQKPRPPDMQPDQFGPPPNYPPPQWNNPEYDQRGSPPPLYIPREEPSYLAVMPSSWQDDPPRQEGPPKPQYTNTQRNVEILNHILSDTELFVEKVTAAMPKENSKKKSKKKNKDQGNASMPPPEEFVDCLKKIKYGFNLLAKLNGILNNPSAPDFVHILFSVLEFLVSQCPRDVPPSVVVPLLVEQSLQFLSKEVTPEEDKLWISLGDTWNIPRSKWPNGDQLPAYIPTFSDGWQPPPPRMAPPETRQAPGRSSQRPASERPAQNAPEQNFSPWSSPPARSSQMLQMRVIYDFMARNHQELSVMKGDVVQVLDQSRQWWKVQNRRGEKGHVPQNVLEPLDGGGAPGGPQGRNSPPLLNKMSRPEEVTAWLEYKGFSKMTVRTIGALNGALLLGMSRDELRAVCPEEGGRVFFQLQAVKSALALASESGHNQYNGR